MSELRDDLIFDVGMHLGEDTAFYLKKGFRVVGIEANPAFVHHCEQRFADAIKAGNLYVVSGAVTARTEATLPFYVNTMETQWGTLKQERVARNALRGAPSRRIEVNRVDVRDLLLEYGVPHYLKVDIEGSDIDVLTALLETPHRPSFLSIETNIHRYSTALGELALLRRLGYSKFHPVQQEAIEGSAVTVRARDGRMITHAFERGSSGPFGEDLPGPWLSERGCRLAYLGFFARYWISGHKSFFRRKGRTGARRKLDSLIGLAGWHDLHARI
jgi:FkbM family methyltransferase